MLGRTLAKFLRLVILLLIVGIDIAKKTHVASIIDEKGNPIGKHFKLSNTKNGFALLLSKISAVESDKTLVKIGMEATGHYWLNIYTYLVDAGFDVHVINPVQSDAIRGLYIRKSKTDTIDSRIIADVIRIGRYSKTNLSSPELLELRDLTRQRFYLVDMISDIKRKVLTVLDRSFPEYATIFSDTFGATSLELLSNLSTAEEILAVDFSKLVEILNSASKGRFGEEKANSIKELAANSFSALLINDSLSFMTKQLVEQIIFLENQLKPLERLIAQKLAAFDNQLQSIPGIGPVLAAAILSEIGDINRFETPDKLAAFAGIDPSVRQSGNFNASERHMSKRGSPYLRRALWLAASCSLLHNPALKAFYDIKKSQGKHHLTALGAVCKKLVNIIFAVLKSNKPYVPVFPS